MPQLQKKAIKGEYKDESELMLDLKRIIGNTTAKDVSAIYVMKQWDSSTEINTISQIFEQNIQSFLNKVIQKKNKKTQDLFRENNQLFYKISIQQFLELVKDTIAGDDELVYEYTLNWLAWIVQKIGEKSGVAPELIGTQRIGKTMFINILCKSFTGYSVPNISSQGGKWQWHVVFDI
ncbi:MAG: hypothetical protein EZS28_029262 [Streblomastix strix]|uniref:CTLH domain-containing protein n=1 Tax=Streblomastix strix TaxID=222440 RepID=A0A5J4UYB0_9EUKA|nr:MAG: hypothetical protein EZS28_029262 [Streblomastix strix]